MKTIVVGGNSKDIGKTSVITGIIAGFPEWPWTAVKITADKDIFSIQEERDTMGEGDTCRFLRAGAKRSIWALIKPGGLREAIPRLWEMIADDPYVIIESNSIMRFVKPDLYLMVLDYSAADFKKSAKQCFDLADVYILIEPRANKPLWQGIPLNPPTDKNIFKVTKGNYITPEILNFVRQKIANSQ